MALLKNKFNLLPHEKQCAEDLFARLAEIDKALQDWFISWDYCKKLLQEQAQIEDMLKKMGYEP